MATKKRKSTKRRTAARRKKAEQRLPAGLGTLFGGLLLMVLAFVQGDSAWRVLHDVLFGLFGCGSFAGNEIAFLKAHAVVTLTQPTGGFMIFAFVAAVVNKLFPGCCCAARGTAFAAAGLADVDCAEKEEV